MGLKILIQIRLGAGSGLGCASPAPPCFPLIYIIFPKFFAQKFNGTSGSGKYCVLPRSEPILD